MSMEKCAGCENFIDTDNDDEAYYLNGEPNQFCLCGNCREEYSDRDYVPEHGDKVEFISNDEFGIIGGQGVVMAAFKNGKIDVMKDGRKYRTHNFYVISKAG